MSDLCVTRTLVKSPPELWTELSEVEGLARHLGEFGEIRISRLDPERAVAWEGEHASGTVAIEASGWGTTVTLTAEIAADDSAPAAPEAPAADPPQPEPDPPAQPPAEPELFIPEPQRRRGRFVGRFLRRRNRSVVAVEPEVAEPEPVRDPEPRPPAVEPPAATVEVPEALVRPDTEPDTEPDPAAVDPERARAVLEGALDSLGQAHHRPFSRG